MVKKLVMLVLVTFCLSLALSSCSSQPKVKMGNSTTITRTYSGTIGPNSSTSTTTTTKTVVMGDSAMITTTTPDSTSTNRYIKFVDGKSVEMTREEAKKLSEEIQKRNPPLLTDEKSIEITRKYLQNLKMLYQRLLVGSDENGRIMFMDKITIISEIEARLVGMEIK